MVRAESHGWATLICMFALFLLIYIASTIEGFLLCGFFSFVIVLLVSK